KKTASGQTLRLYSIFPSTFLNLAKAVKLKQQIPLVYLRGARQSLPLTQTIQQHSWLLSPAPLDRSSAPDCRILCQIVAVRRRSAHRRFARSLFLAATAPAAIVGEWQVEVARPHLPTTQDHWIRDRSLAIFFARTTQNCPHHLAGSGLMQAV